MGWDDKPCLIGEIPANGLGGFSSREGYLRARRNGWAGCLAWTANGVDLLGDIDDLEGVMNHPELQ